MKPREEAECEVHRDLKKKTNHLLIDVYVELLKKDRDIQENMVHANKRMFALTARSILWMTRLTVSIAIMTSLLVVLTVVLIVKAA